MFASVQRKNRMINVIIFKISFECKFCDYESKYSLCDHGIRKGIATYKAFERQTILVTVDLVFLIVLVAAIVILAGRRFSLQLPTELVVRTIVKELATVCNSDNFTVNKLFPKKNYEYYNLSIVQLQL